MESLADAFIATVAVVFVLYLRAAFRKDTAEKIKKMRYPVSPSWK